MLLHLIQKQKWFAFPNFFI